MFIPQQKSRLQSHAFFFLRLCNALLPSYAENTSVTNPLRVYTSCVQDTVTTTKSAGYTLLDVYAATWRGWGIPRVYRVMLITGACTYLAACDDSNRICFVTVQQSTFTFWRILPERTCAISKKLNAKENNWLTTISDSIKKPVCFRYSDKPKLYAEVLCRNWCVHYA